MFKTDEAWTCVKNQLIGNSKECHAVIVLEESLCNFSNRFDLGQNWDTRVLAGHQKPKSIKGQFKDFLSKIKGQM